MADFEALIEARLIDDRVSLLNPSMAVLENFRDLQATGDLHRYGNNSTLSGREDVIYK